jgi:hypothetical protein
VLLCDRRQSHAILRQAADVELKLKLVTEEARERMDDDAERRRPLGCLVNHPPIRLRRWMWK